MSVILAEELLLLAYHDETGKALVGGELNVAIAGALVAELAINGRIDLDGKKVAVVDPSPLGDDELDAVLARMAGEAKVRKPAWWVGRISSEKVRRRLLGRLAERGILSAQQVKVLGIFPATRYPEQDGGVERELRQRVASVLAGAEPDARLAMLIAVLQASGVLKKTFPDAPKDRVKEITEGAWAGEAVRATIAAVNAAIMSAVIAAVVAGSTS
ncbi:GOLPH3/VPS74 family protein [Acrocarpospora catenulata]|uniref:GOLPH3/VPS74 family protein n=1 Tax=Acrocarpospora catenulata TaxID=2836182 RepID=UPI001BDB5114|nr:GPP34 family phosphoprotein [Acrocarpospora catenulata]